MKSLEEGSTVKFRVMYQREPFHYNDPAFLTVEAKDRVDAYLAAYNELASHGVVTHEAFPGDCHGDMFNAEEFARLKASGLPYEGYPCSLHIRRVEPLPQVARSGV